MRLGPTLVLLTTLTIPGLSLAQNVVPGRIALTPRQVDAAASRRISRVKRCYKDAVAKTPGLFGLLAVGFHVAADGSIKDRFIASSTMGDPALEACALTAFDGLSFPAPGGDGADVRFGMLLTIEEKKKTDRNTEMPDRAKILEETWKKTIQGN